MQVGKTKTQSHHLSPLPFLLGITKHTKEEEEEVTYHVSSSFSPMPHILLSLNLLPELLHCSLPLRSDHPFTRSTPGRIPAILRLCHPRRKETESSVLLLRRS